MQACDDLMAMGLDVAQPREGVELMGANPSETAYVQRDHGQRLASSGRVA